MNPAVDNEFQQWLSQINQVCGNFTGRLLTERYTGVLDTHFAKGLKLSTVTTNGVNLSRTWQEVKGSDDAWFYTVFQLSGQAIMEQDVWGSDQFWAEFVQPGRTCKPCVARGMVI